jgi:hypothetical protein
LSNRTDKEHIDEYLKQMIKDKPKNEPLEQTLATFCQRYSLDMEQCQTYYEELVKKGSIKEK